MLGSVLQYVLGIVFGFFGAVLLLRAWLYYWALSPRHPLCELTRKITDWLGAPRPSLRCFSTARSGSFLPRPWGFSLLPSPCFCAGRSR